MSYLSCIYFIKSQNLGIFSLLPEWFNFIQLIQLQDNFFLITWKYNSLYLITNIIKVLIYNNIESILFYNTIEPILLHNTIERDLIRLQTLELVSFCCHKINPFVTINDYNNECYFTPTKYLIKTWNVIRYK